MPKRKRNNGQVVGGVIGVDTWHHDEFSDGPLRLHFLSHLHADHTDGLNSSWLRPIYTSPVNCSLARHLLPTLNQDLLVPLDLDTEHVLPLGGKDEAKVCVTLYDASHVPGAVMFLFRGFFGNVLYTADCRFDSSDFLDKEPLATVLRREDLDTVYLDNTFFFPSCTFPSRSDVVNRLVTFIEQHPQHHVYIGLKKLGKEAALVALAQALREKICVSQDKYELFRTLELPNVFTTCETDSRIHTVHAHLIKRKFLEDENAKRPTLGIVLTALFYGWPTGGPYSSSHKYGLHLFEYSDHSSYTELLDMVERLKPKQILPVVDSAAAIGFLRDWPGFHTGRTDMSQLRPYLSKLPPKFWSVPKFKSPPAFSFYTKGQKRRRAIVARERVYRGPKGPVYDSLCSEASGISKTEKEEDVIVRSVSSQLWSIVDEIKPPIPLKVTMEIHKCLDMVDLL